MPVDARPAQGHNGRWRGLLKLLAVVALLPAFGAALSLWFVFSDEVAFAVSSATVLLFVLILLGPVDTRPAQAQNRGSGSQGGAMTQSNESVLSLVKDIGLGLVQISGLLLTINLAVVVGALPEEARAEITGQVFASSVLLGVSIAIGLVVLAFLTEIMGRAKGKKDGLETAARLLSTAQLGTFLAAMALMIWAVRLRLTG